MSNIQIMTERSYQNWPSWGVVYEWEDVMADVLDAELLDLHTGFFGKAARAVRKVYRKSGLKGHFSYDSRRPVRLVWVMDARIYKEYTYPNFIPIFLDFSIDMVDEIFEATKNLPFFWVTCISIYEKLKEKTTKVHYIPLSISDKWISQTVKVKDIDVIQFGRKNAILHEYMLNYCKSHPNVEYVFQTSDGSLTYTSTIRGNMGRFDTRVEYMKMISRSRVSLVSTPAIDSGKDFGGIDFFTPRFYESAAQYCHLIGRYTDNSDQ